ncbi:MAG: cytosine permease, partial [Firmicutes bacterium]|nr:cytosine permease [Bacillota bacterium]
MANRSTSIPEESVDRAFHMEAEGTDIISASQRHGRPKELFAVWLAAVLTSSGVVIGELFTSLGLGIGESFAVALLCSLSFVILGWASASGPKAGTVTLTISRAAFGVRGNVVPAFFSWLSAVGWESVTMVLTVYALLSLAQLIGWASSGVLPTLIALTIAILFTYIVPTLGHATVVSMQKIFAYALAVAALLVIIAIFPHVNWHFSPPAKDMAADGRIPTMILAASIGLISSVWGWTNYAADYSRYLPASTKSRTIIGYTALGAGIASFIVMGLGILLGTFISPSAFNANSIQAIAHAVPQWWAVVPFLIIVIMGN